MHSPQPDNLQSSAVVRPVAGLVGNLCPWCAEPLKLSKTKPRVYCSEAHEKRYKRAGCKSKQQCERDAQAAVDAWLAYENQGRAFSTFANNDPISELPNIRVVHEKDKPWKQERRKQILIAGQHVSLVWVGAACPIVNRRKDGPISQLGILEHLPVHPVLPPFRTFTPATPLFIGPLLKNGRSRSRQKASEPCI